MNKTNVIRIKILLSFFVVVFIPFLLLGFVSIDTIKRELNKEVDNTLLSLAEAKEGQVFEYFDYLKARTEDFASDESLRSFLASTSFEGITNEKLNDVLRRKINLDPYLLAASVLDNTGKVIASSDLTRLGKQESSGQNFRKGRLGYHLEYSKSAYHDEEKLLIASIPIMDKEGRYSLGVLVNYFSMAKLENVFGGSFQQAKGALSYKSGLRDPMNMYLIDSEMDIIAFSEKRSFTRNMESNTVKADVLPVRSCIEERREVLAEYQNFRNKAVMGTSMCLLEPGWTLLVEMERSQLQAIIDRTRNKMILIVTGIVMLSLLMSWYISDILVAPTREVLPGKGKYYKKPEKT